MANTRPEEHLKRDRNVIARGRRETTTASSVASKSYDRNQPATDTGLQNGKLQRPSESVLIIDDDLAICETLKLLFEMEGYQTATAANGDSALELVDGGVIAPDIVVADYALPGKFNGLQAVAQLRARLDSELPVLILTGDISDGTSREIDAAVCIRLIKPLKTDTLLSEVRRQLVPSETKIGTVAEPTAD